MVYRAAPSLTPHPPRPPPPTARTRPPPPDKAAPVTKVLRRPSSIKPPTPRSPLYRLPSAPRPLHPARAAPHPPALKVKKGVQEGGEGDARREAGKGQRVEGERLTPPQQTPPMDIEGKQTPPQGKETPPQGKETPPQGKETPPQVKESLLEGKKVPPETKENHSERKEFVPIDTEGRETPPEGKETSPETEEIPPEGKETPPEMKELVTMETEGKETPAEGKEPTVEGRETPVVETEVKETPSLETNSKQTPIEGKQTPVMQNDEEQTPPEGRQTPPGEIQTPAVENKEIQTPPVVKESGAMETIENIVIPAAGEQTPVEGSEGVAMDTEDTVPGAAVRDTCIMKDEGQTQSGDDGDGGGGDGGSQHVVEPGSGGDDGGGVYHISTTNTPPQSHTLAPHTTQHEWRQTRSQGRDDTLHLVQGTKTPPLETDFPPEWREIPPLVSEGRDSCPAEEKLPPMETDEREMPLEGRKGGKEGKKQVEGVERKLSLQLMERKTRGGGGETKRRRRIKEEEEEETNKGGERRTKRKIDNEKTRGGGGGDVKKTPRLLILVEGSTASGGGGSRASRDSRGISSSSTPAPPPRSSTTSISATSVAADKKRQDPTSTTSTGPSAPRRPRLESIKSSLATKPARLAPRKATDPVKAARPGVNTLSGAPRGTHLGGHNGPAHLPAAPTPTAADHVKRLEAEAAARAAEVRAAREEKEEVTKAVEALTVLLHHLANTYDPFSTPKLKAEIRKLNEQLTETRLSLDESSVAIRRLQEAEASTAERHSIELKELKEQHHVTLEQLAAQHKHDLDLALEKHRKELSKFAEDQQTQRDEVSRAHTAEVEQLEGEWRAKLDVQHEKHLCALQELNTRHMQQVRELETSRRARERELEEANFRLQEEQATLKVQSKKLEETLLNDTDHRLAAVRKMCTSLKSEVDSLKSVVEMKNSEIHGLRSQVVEVGRLTADLEAARERARALQAKTEDLQAQMEKKAQQERSLVNEHRLLVETCQRESNVNKRLSLENEELAWKLRQREELIMSVSAPPPSTSTPSSLDMVSRTSASPRAATPQATPRSPRVAPRACGSVSPCKSEPGRRRHRGGGGVEVTVGAPDSPPPSPCVKAVVEKSNSVSFILDLTEGRHTDTSPEVPLSPRRRPHRTASLSAADRPRTPALAHVRRAARNNRANTLGRVPPEVNGGSGGGGGPHVNGRRSTSESSENGSGEVSRVSPTGLAWTVPVRGPCTAAPPAPPRTAPRQLLQDPQEDEYECAPQGEAPPRFLEAAGLALTSSSEAASDSELSQCSLKGGSSSSDSESDGAEGAPRPAPPLCPKDGAGEAMIPDELLQQYGGGAPLSPTSPALTRGPRRRLHSSPSSDSDENTTPHNDHDDDDDDDEAGQPADVSWSEDVDVTSSSELHDDL